jgi:thiamine biosynthesis lipoprotein
MQAFTEDFQHYHILGLRTCISSPELASATILTASTTLADGLVTAVMVMGRGQGVELIERLESIEAYLAGKDTWTYNSAGLRTLV